MKVLTWALLLVTSLFLVGCVAPIQYQFQPGAAKAKINLQAARGSWMCLAGQRYNLVPDHAGYADLPADERIGLGRTYYYSDGFNTYRCMPDPAVTFVPKADVRYTANFEIRGQRCSISVFKEDESTPTGLDYERSIGVAKNGCP